MQDIMKLQQEEGQHHGYRSRKKRLMRCRGYCPTCGRQAISIIVMHVLGMWNHASTQVPFSKSKYYPGMIIKECTSSSKTEYHLLQLLHCLNCMTC